MARSAGAFVIAAVMIASGCMGSSSSSSSPSTSAPKVKESPTHTVRVPKLVMVSMDQAMARLHHAGLRIAIPKPWAHYSFDEPLAVATSLPTRLPAGSVVALQVGRLLGSPGGALGRHVVPDVVGKRLDQATHQIYAAKLPWYVRATSLPPTSATSLFSQYCVTSQSPDAGTVIVVGLASFTPISEREVELHAKPC